MDRRNLLALIAAAAALPMLARAREHRQIPRIGVLWHAGDVRGETPYFEALIEEFEALGYTSGKIEFEHRFPDEKPELFESMAAELVALSPDVIVGVSSAAAYVKRATSTIPIVFMYVPDPIGANLVETIRHPGGNATGLSNFGVDLSPKRLEYLKEAVPSLSKVALLLNSTNKISSRYVEESNEVAHTRNIADQACSVFHEAAYVSIVHDQVDHESASRSKNEHAHLKQATGASPIIVRAVNVPQHRAISKEADIF